MPIIKLRHHCFLEGLANFLIDTGSQLNIIKQKGIDPNLIINTNIIYNLTGIDSGNVHTFGEIIIQVRNIDVKFQIVDNNFPIAETGILGMPFLEKQNAILKFGGTESNSLLLGNEEYFFISSASFNLPPRTKTLIAPPVKETKRKTGYIKL